MISHLLPGIDHLFTEQYLFQQISYLGERVLTGRKNAPYFNLSNWNLFYIDPDPEEPIPTVETELEVSEDNIDKSNDKKREAIHAYNDGKYEEAVNAYSEAIALNPSKY